MQNKRGCVSVVNRKTSQVYINSARWCESYLCKFLGFQFRRRLKSGEALILVHETDSIKGSSIHMFFVFMNLAVVWINKEGRVTSAQLARPWRPYYASPEPACYVLETSPEILDRISPGDEIDFVPKMG